MFQWPRFKTVSWILPGLMVAACKGLMDVSVMTSTPVIMGVLTCLEESQAVARSTGENNHGIGWGETDPSEEDPLCNPFEKDPLYEPFEKDPLCDPFEKDPFCDPSEKDPLCILSLELSFLFRFLGRFAQATPRSRWAFFE